MKNEKLNSLIHKLVELKNETNHLKGFLFKDNDLYYIKPIEVYLGSAKETVKYYLTEDDVLFIEFCESPKLMKVSMKSWHYRLMKYVLGQYVPTPQTMQNGCPYFWLLIFSMLVVPFKYAGNGLVSFFLGFPYLFWKAVEWLAYITLRAIPEEKAYGIDYYGNQYRGTYDVPIFASVYFKNSRKSFIDTYIRVKYGIDKEIDPIKYQEKVDALMLLRKTYEDNRALVNSIRREKQRVELEKSLEIDRIRNKKRKLRQKRNELFWRPVNEILAKIKKSISNTLTFDYRRSPIIKRTKQFIGLIISLIVLVAVSMAVIMLTTTTIAIIDGIGYLFANYAGIIFTGLAIILLAIILTAIGYFVYNWVQGLVGKYEVGKKIWYVEGVLYAIWYPVQYLAKFLFYAIYYVFYKPLYFILFIILYNGIIINSGMFIWNIMKALGAIIMGSLGIFGEYFGASKKDYCPGLEWVDTDDE